jgi:transcriptional regulator
MYIPEHFAESRIEVLFNLIEKNPPDILFTNGRSGLDANHISLSPG